MGWDGAGGYTRQHNFSADASASIKILASRMDTEFNDFASAMTIAWARNGQNTPTQDIPMGGRKFVNVAAATSVSNYMRAREFIENIPIFMQDVESSADRVSVSSQYFTSVSANQAPSDGVKIFVRANSNKSSAVLYVDGHSANIEYQDGNRIGPAMVSGGVYELIYSSVDTAWKIQNPDDGRTAAEIAAGVTPTNYQYEVGDIRRYGAADSTDSNTAINNALKSNKTVWVPESGTYLFTALLVPTGVTFFSKGGTLKFKDGTAINGATQYFPIASTGDGATAGEADNITIRDLKIDGNKANNSVFLVCDAITIGGVNAQVLNNQITNPPDSGIMWSGVIGGRCVGNYIEGATDAGIYANDSNGSFDSRLSVISENVCVSCAQTGIGVKRYLSLLTVNNNAIYECGTGINSEDFGSGVNPNYVSITGNVVVRAGFGAGASGTGYGIYAQGPGIGMIVNNNLIYDCNNGHLVIGGTKYSSYQGNVIVGTSNGTADSHGIWLIPNTGKANEYNTIAYNKVYDVDGYGIWAQNNVVSDNPGNKIIGNTVIDSSNEGLRVDDDYTNGEILNNDLDGTTNDFDYAVANGTNVTNRVSGNILRNGNISGNTGWQTGSYQEIYGDGIKITWGDGTPTVGTWEDGSISRQVPLAAPDGSNMVLREFACTVAGSPGTWVSQYTSTVSPAT